jgi:hypothetical protein
VLVRHFSQETIGQLNLSQSLAVQGMAELQHDFASLILEPGLISCMFGNDVPG